MANEKLTTKEYWDNQRQNFVPFTVESTEFSKILDKLLPVNSSYQCAEIGAYPGTNLCYLSKKFKYRPVAIEYSGYANHIEQLFLYNGITDFEIINKDFFDVENVKFDVVASFGFVEHFENYEHIIERHFQLLKPGGYIIISVPYDGGFQGLLRKLVFTQEQLQIIKSTHNRKIMNLKKLRRIVRSFNGKILFSNYILGSRVWFSWDALFVKNTMRFLVYIINVIDRLIGHKVPSSRLYSPMILVVAQKEL